MVNADRETLLAEQRDLLQTIAEHKENNSKMANQQHQNYGKTPAYIEKYKQEANLKSEAQAAERAKANIPKGMRQLPEKERVDTLEDLLNTRNELNKMLQTMPISMRSENLKQKKREIEEKLK